MSFFQVQNLQVSYGGIQAVKGVSLSVAEGELVTLIGANGAGKTSTMKALMGMLPFVADRLSMGNVNLTRVPSHERVGMGLAMVTEGRGVFTRMSIHENLLMGAYGRNDPQGIQDDLAKMFEWFPRLKERRDQLAGTLSGGEQQMLAMSRALMSRPRMLLLDEPSMGLSPIMVDKIFEVIRKVAQAGMTLLLVEQNANLALQIADRGYVMDSGKVILEGSGQALLSDPKVREAYLGA